MERIRVSARHRTRTHWHLICPVPRDWTARLLRRFCASLRRSQRGKDKSVRCFRGILGIPFCRVISFHLVGSGRYRNSFCLSCKEVEVNAWTGFIVEHRGCHCAQHFLAIRTTMAVLANPTLNPLCVPDET